MTNKEKEKIEADQLILAIDIAEKAHRGQTRRDGKTPYLSHVWKVLNNVQWRNGENRSFLEETVAMLHDVVEDTEYTLATLREMGICEEVLTAVDALTHRKGESYENAILRAKANPMACKVKIADNLANLSDSPTDKQILKYSKSLQVLLAH